MGCDIHTYYERRNKETGAWEHITPGEWATDEYTVSGTVVETRYWDAPWQNCKHYLSRNYWLFGLLAQVRLEVEPSFTPKGEIPGDSCSEIQEEFERWDSDAHTPSYLSVQEMLEHIANHCTPTAKMLALVERKQQDQEDLAAIESTLGQLAQNMLELAGDGYAPDDVRMVFWFDN